MEQINTFEEQRACLICDARAKSVVFLPCAHMMACHNCGPRLIIRRRYRCPAPGCNQVIHHVVVAREVLMLGDEQIAQAGFS